MCCASSRIPGPVPERPPPLVPPPPADVAGGGGAVRRLAPTGGAVPLPCASAAPPADGSGIPLNSEDTHLILPSGCTPTDAPHLRLVSARLCLPLSASCAWDAAFGVFGVFTPMSAAFMAVCPTRFSDKDHFSLTRRMSGRAAELVGTFWCLPVRLWTSTGHLLTLVRECDHGTRHAAGTTGVPAHKHSEIVERCGTEYPALNLRSYPGKKKTPPEGALLKRQLHTTHLGRSAPMLWPASELSGLGVSIHVWRRR